MAEPVIKLIFERVALTPSDTVVKAQALALYSIGLFAYSSNMVSVTLFYIIEKLHFPAIASFLAICTNAIFINLTIELFQHRAIALPVSVTMVINHVFLIAILYQGLQGFCLQRMIKAIVKIVSATLLMTLFLMVSKYNTIGLMRADNVWQTGVTLFLIILIAVAVYSASLYFLRRIDFLILLDRV